MSSINGNQDDITFEEFCEEWLAEFRNGTLTSLEKGQQFAIKLVTQWLGVNGDDDDLLICDGSGDGGIDIAYLHRADIEDDAQGSQSVEGDTWYLVQSKYGTSFQGQGTIVEEGRKIISTLAGENTRLSETVTQLVGRLATFKQQVSDRDRIVLVFATEQPISESDRRALAEIRLLGSNRFPDVFDVEDISLQTIWETRDTVQAPAMSLPIIGNFVDPAPGVRVGTIPLTQMYQFLAGYRDKTGNLDQLYEKNVRQFLGSRRKINRWIANTLRDSPELFGLYNNGITIVVSDYTTRSDGSCLLSDPYVVNGCQTTRTIWDVLRQRLDSGGTGKSEELDDWRQRAEQGVVVAKIVKGDSAQITDITRFTNSQNAVREQDFIALHDDFRSWQRVAEERYGIYLEIQRGGWDGRKAYQKSHPGALQFSEAANAFDLLKVYAAGWLREPGTANGARQTFHPGGRTFIRITEGDERINVDDMYAAFRLQEMADQFKFGRRAENPSRGLTKYLFYFVVLEFLRETLIRANGAHSNTELTKALLVLDREENWEALDGLLYSSIEVIDEYLNRESDDSVFKEPEFQDDVFRFLKSDRLGRNEDFAPLLKSLVSGHKRLFGRRRGPGQSSPRDLIAQAVT